MLDARFRSNYGHLESELMSKPSKEKVAAVTLTCSSSLSVSINDDFHRDVNVSIGLFKQ